MNMFGITPAVAPIVIDSDPRKVGGYVPGMGQLIRSPQYIVENKIDRILICTNWRARDIEEEIRNVLKLDIQLLVYQAEAIRDLTADLDL